MAATDWTTLDAEIVTGRMTDYELELYREKYLAPSADPDADGDPLPEIITDVSNEVRAYVQSCQRNIMAAAPQIPKSCLRHAANLVIFQLLSRIPRLEISEQRTELKQDAIEFFKGVARCQPIMEPGAESGEGSTNRSGIQKSSGPARRASREQLGGL